MFVGVLEEGCVPCANYENEEMQNSYDERYT